MLIDEKLPHCSYCDSSDVDIHSSFGTAQLVRQYYCNACSSVFEYIRWQENSEVKNTELKNN